ncbi:MAG: hypothetical protein HYX34_09125 [Actinobacteria bacterium]|nr:hypothetical protein [Actinomycetota bacterium]
MAEPLADHSHRTGRPDLGAPPRPGTTAPQPSGPSGGEAWPAQAADTIVRVVGQVRDKTTGPAITATRALVYGALAAILGTTALVLVTILLVRGLSIAIADLLGVVDLNRPGRGLWIAEALVGAMASTAGLVALRRAARPRRA